MIKFSGENCKKFAKIPKSGPNITSVTVETNVAILGDHLKTFKNIEKLEDCINICHMTRQEHFIIDTNEIMSDLLIKIYRLRPAN